MNYLSPIEYTKLINSLMESDSITSEDTIPVVGELSLKERVSNLSPDDKKQLEQYIKSINEVEI